MISVASCTIAPDKTEVIGEDKIKQSFDWTGVKIESFYLIPYSGEKERLNEFLDRKDITILRVEKIYRSQAIVSGELITIYYKVLP